MAKVGSARADERGSISGGKAGDQNTREVSIQQYYMHSKGWNLLRAKKDSVANKLADAMKDACDNKNIGYDQGQRGSIVPLFEKTKDLSKINTPCECDCSKLVQLCVWQATGDNPGNFTTLNAVDVLSDTGHFNAVKSVNGNTKLQTGDILCTKTKGHIVIVVEGEPREPKPTKPPKDSKIFETTNPLNIRSGPGTYHSRLGVLPEGTDCEFIKGGYFVGSTEWYKVKAKGITGYVSSKYLRAVK